MLHEFAGHDGFKPTTGLALGRNGVLFGLTSTGGRFGGGTAFKITTDGKFTVLHDFGGKPDDGQSGAGRRSSSIAAGMPPGGTGPIPPWCIA